MKLNPIFVVICLFLVVGLIWSGGHVAWFIFLGVYVFLGAVGGALNMSKKK